MLLYLFIYLLRIEIFFDCNPKETLILRRISISNVYWAINKIRDTSYKSMFKDILDTFYTKHNYLPTTYHWTAQIILIRYNFSLVSRVI